MAAAPSHHETTGKGKKKTHNSKAHHAEDKKISKKGGFLRG